MKKLFISTFVAVSLLITAGPAFAQNKVVEDINEYLTNLISASSRFTQVSTEGYEVYGQFYLLKPGKLRFEYDPPSESLMIADGQALAIFDKKSNRGPQRYLQSSTPLSLLARNDIDVTKSTFVQYIEVVEDEVHMILLDRDRPAIGVILMVFEQDPMKLVRWTIIEDSGEETSIILHDMEENVEIDPDLFNIVKTIRLFEEERDE